MNDYLKMGILAVVIIVGIVIAHGQTSNDNLGFSQNSNIFYANSATTTQHGSAWLSSAASELIFRNDNRHFVKISLKPNSTNTAWIWQSTSTADIIVGAGGIPLSSTTDKSYTIDSNNLYRGEIQGIGGGDVEISWIEQ